MWCECEEGCASKDEGWDNGLRTVNGDKGGSGEQRLQSNGMLWRRKLSWQGGLTKANCVLLTWQINLHGDTQNETVVGGMTLFEFKFIEIEF